jgi:hypothetical protein
VYESPQRLLLLLELADYLGSSDLVDDCLQYLYSIVNSAEPSWSVLLFCCNSTCTDGISSSPFFQPLRSLSWQRSAEHLQDLEAVMQHRQKASQFLAVPFELLLQLVSSFETRVASESTVVFAIHLWLASQPQGSVSMEQRRLLAKQVRLTGMSALFLAQVLPYVEWYRTAIGIGEEAQPAVTGICCSVVCETSRS